MKLNGRGLLIWAVRATVVGTKLCGLRNLTCHRRGRVHIIIFLVTRRMRLPLHRPRLFLKLSRLSRMVMSSALRVVWPFVAYSEQLSGLITLGVVWFNILPNRTGLGGM